MRIKLLGFILLTLLSTLLGCQREKNSRPNFHFYYSDGYLRNNPFNYIAFKEDYIYIMRKGFSAFNEAVIEVPINGDTIGNEIIKNIVYYYFDISTTNKEFGKRSVEDSSKSIQVRNVIQYIFELNVSKTPDFEGLKEYNGSEFEKKKFNNNLSFLIFIPNEEKCYVINETKNWTKEEKRILNWISFLSDISFVEAMYYDMFTGNYNSDFHKYPELKNYVIPSNYWEKK